MVATMLEVGTDEQPAAGAPPLPATVAPPSPAPASVRAGIVALPARAALLAIAGLVLSTLVPVPIVRSAAAIGMAPAALLAVGMAAQWSMLLGACWAASVLFGTGHLRADFGLVVRREDLDWGLRVWVLARTAAMVVALPFALLGGNLLASNDKIFDFFSDPVSLVVLGLVTVVGAPVVEELFFRGLVQGCLRPVVGAVGAIVGQGLVFGSVHTHSVASVSDVSVVAVPASVGMPGVVLPA